MKYGSSAAKSENVGIDDNEPIISRDIENDRFYRYRNLADSFYRGQPHA